VEIAVVVLVVLAACGLPLIALRELSIARAGHSDLTQVESAVDAVGRDMTSVEIALNRYELTPGAAVRQEFESAVVATERSLTSLAELDEPVDLGLASQVVALTRATRRYLDAATAYGQAIEGDLRSMAETRARFLLEKSQLHPARAAFEDESARTHAALARDGASAESRARTLNITAAAVAGVGVGAAAALTARRTSEHARGRVAAADEAAAQRATALNIASHELRNPLAAISMNLELIDARGDPDIRVQTGHALRAAHRAEELVAELLDVSRLDAGEMRFDIAPVPVLPVVEEAVQTVADYRPAHRVKLLGDTSAVALADALRLQIILRNLLDNAFKYSPEGSEVAVRLVEGGPKVVVEVTDEGPGVPEAERERVFSRFRRLEQTQHIAGTGLGLYLSRELARRMGGDLESAGNCMRLEMPTAPRPG